MPLLTPQPPLGTAHFSVPLRSKVQKSCLDLISSFPVLALTAVYLSFLPPPPPKRLSHCRSNGPFSVLIWLDLLAAFDTVDHFLLEIYSFSSQDTVSSWFPFFLAGECFSVSCAPPSPSSGLLNMTIPQWFSSKHFLFSNHASSWGSLFSSMTLNAIQCFCNSQISFHTLDLCFDSRLIIQLPTWPFHLAISQAARAQYVQH